LPETTIHTSKAMDEAKDDKGKIKTVGEEMDQIPSFLEMFGKTKYIKKPRTEQDLNKIKEDY
jgi:hypothetical protein